MTPTDKVRETLINARAEFWDDWHSGMSVETFNKHWLIIDIDKSLEEIAKLRASGDVDRETIKQECLDDILKGRSTEYKDVYYQIISEAVNYMIQRGHLHQRGMLRAGVDSKTERINEIAGLIVDTLDGKAPMSKWMRNTAVKTLDDLEWMVKSQLKECHILQAQKELEEGDEDLTDWALGKQSAFDNVLQNIHQIKEHTKVEPIEGLEEAIDIGTNIITNQEEWGLDVSGHKNIYINKVLEAARKYLEMEKNDG